MAKFFASVVLGTNTSTGVSGINVDAGFKSKEDAEAFLVGKPVQWIENVQGTTLRCIRTTIEIDVPD